MASGATHGRVTRTLAIPVLFLVYFQTGSVSLGIIAFLGCLLGLVIEPDLDIKLVTASERRMKRIPVVGNIWYFIWLPYANFLPHRSLISHLPIISTLIRYIYLAIFIVPIWLMITAITFSDPMSFLALIQNYQVELFYLVLGNAIADYGHFTMDVKWVILANGKIKFL